jgi:hypothetical protein
MRAMPGRENLRRPLWLRQLHELPPEAVVKK